MIAPQLEPGPDAGCPVSPEEQRRRTNEQTGGPPWTEFPAGTTPYAEYADMDVLLSLQHPRTGAATEPMFIIISQVKELLFKLLHTELEEVRAGLAADRVGDALWTLRRADRVQRLLLACWDTMGALAPNEFAQFRDILGQASGFQSASYRRLEFLLGNKNPAMVRPHRDSPHHDEVLDQLHRPSLYDEVLDLLARRGLPVPAEILRRDVTEPHTADPRVEAAWLEVYRAPEKYPDLYLLAEALTDTADLYARWRYTHLVIVQRMLGDKPGTGGTDGVAWLSRISEHRFFPELWSVRSTL